MPKTLATGLRCLNLSIVFALLVCVGVLEADIQSSTGNIHFDANSDGSREVSLSNSGLGLGTETASSNLHVLGNAAIENGNVGIGTTSANNSLEINGTFGINVESVSANTTLSGNSIVLVDTSSDNVLVSLPYAGNVSGRTYDIKKISASNHLWIHGGGNQIDDLGSLEILPSSATLPTVSLISDGSQWYILSGNHHQHVAADNLLAWWKFDEVSGNIAADSFGGSHAGNLVDSFTFTGNIASGVNGGALDFDGSGDYIDFGTTTMNFVDESFSVSLWFNRDVVAGSDQLIGKHYYLQEGWHVTLDTLNRVSGYLEDNSTNLMSCLAQTQFSANTWHHLVAIFDRGPTQEYSVYVNGSEQAYFHSQDLSSLGDTSSVQNFTIGATHWHWTITNFFDGQMDDIRIYNKALNADEVKALFQYADPSE